MENITLQVFISFVVSVIVSAATFLVGVRVGKEKSDRAELRGMYKEIYQHLAQLRGHLDELRPKHWDHYLGDDQNSWPPIRRMERDGDIHLLPRRFAARLKQLEFDALKAGTIYRNWLDMEYGPWAKKLLSVPASAFDTRRSVPTADIAPDMILCAEDKVRDFGKMLDERPAMSLCFIVPRDHRGGERIHVYPEHKPADVFRDMRSKAREELQFTEFVDTESKAIIARIDDLLPVIEHRIEDPHPIWQTLKAVFLDLRKDD